MWKINQLQRIYIRTQYPSQITCNRLFQLRQFSKKLSQNQEPQHEKSDEKYQYWKDPRLRGVAGNIAMFFLIVFFSGKLTQYLIKNYVSEEATLIPQLNKEVSQGKKALPLTEQNLDFLKAQRLTPYELKNKAYFGINRNYFIQLIDDTQSPTQIEQELSDQYYTLHRLTRKKNQPIFPYRVYLSDFQKDEGFKLLTRSLNISSPEEFKEIDFVVINEDKMKMPIYKNDNTSHAIGFKFIQNPTRIDNLDDLYDALEINKGTNVKYVVICNTLDWKTPAQMNLQQKLFRKFFYENSSFIETEVKFIEITNSRVAQRIGITGQDQIYVIQNKNPFSSIKGSNEFKLMNLDLEKICCDSLIQSSLERKYAKYLIDLSRKEFEDLLMCEENLDEVFSYFSEFIEDALINLSESGIIYVQTQNMLRFYKNHFKSRLNDVLFIQDTQDNLSHLSNQLRDKSRANNREQQFLPIIMTDIKDSASFFNLFDENQKCMRLIRYGYLFNDKSKKIIKLRDILQDEKLKKECEVDYKHLYTLKYKIQDVGSDLQKCFDQQMSPYLETDTLKNNESQIEGIQTLNRDNYQSILNKKDISIIEVYGRKCPGCKKIDSILTSLKSNLESKQSNTQLVRIDIMNEVEFLKDIDKTPSFLVYSKRKGKFEQVNTKVKPQQDDSSGEQQQQIDYEDSEVLIEYLTKAINETIKKI